MMRSARGSSKIFGESSTWCAARRSATRSAVLLLRSSSTREQPLLERNRHDDAIVRADVVGDVPLARRVFDQVDMAGCHLHLLAIAHRELRLARKGDDELPSRPGVPVAGRGRRTAAE